MREIHRNHRTRNRAGRGATLGALALFAASAAHSAADSVDCRIGIVAYQGWSAENSEYVKALWRIQEASADGGDGLNFRLAVGTYEDVLHWFREGHLDAAIMTPGVYGQLLQLEEDDRNRNRYGVRSEYLGTRVKRAGKVVLKHQGVTRGGEILSPPETALRPEYYSVCITNKNSGLETVEDIRDCLESGELEIFMVNRLSTSGGILPLHALASEGIDREQVARASAYKGSHDNVLGAVLEDTGGTKRIGFICDYTEALSEDEAKIENGLNVIPLGELAHPIPEDVLITAEDSGIRTLLLAALEATGEEHGGYFRKLDEHEELYARVRDFSGYDTAQAVAKVSPIDLDEIVWQLWHYVKFVRDPKDFRLALVMSGGGAKCSYQVGVVAEFERSMADLRRQLEAEIREKLSTAETEADRGRLRDRLERLRALDLSLVVGTSGGAINSVPIAMRTLTTAEGAEKLTGTWKSIHQKELLRPHWTLRYVHGIWVGIAIVGIVCILRRVFRWGRRSTRYILAAAGVIVGVWAIWSSLPVAIPTDSVRNPLVSVYLQMGAGLTALILLAAACAAGFLCKNRGALGFVTPRRLLAALFFGLPALQAFNLLYVQRSLFSGSSTPDLISEAYADLAGLEHGEIGDVGRNICAKIKRDLLITASLIETTNQRGDDVEDVYFYYSQRRGGRGLPEGNIIVDLRERPGDLCRVVAGSGSIYPMFPSIPLRHVDALSAKGPKKLGDTRLIDGGFAHNSPVHAAAAWGASHVVVVDASPKGRTVAGGFGKNLLNAFSFLHDQAQTIDVLARDKMVVYMIRPEARPGRIGLIDFLPDVVDAAIQEGRLDALAGIPGARRGGVNAPGTPRFRKRLGHPTFSKLTSEVVGAD